MSDALSQEFAQDAIDMLTENGVPVTVTGDNLGPMTPSGDRGLPPEPRTALGLIFPAKGTVLVGGVEKASERVVMTPVDPWPTPGERLEVNGRSLVIGDDGVKTYAPQGLAIVHDVAVAS